MSHRPRLTLIAAVYDLIIALPESVFNAIHGPAIKAFGQQYLPFADLGLGWICPTLIGAAIGLIAAAAVFILLSSL